MKKYLWLFILLTVGAILAFIAYAPFAFFNKKTGTLLMWARFRFHRFRLLDHIGQTVSIKKGNVWFQADFQTIGAVEYSINDGTNKPLLEGKCDYEVTENVTTTLPQANDDEAGRQLTRVI